MTPSKIMLPPGSEALATYAIGSKLKSLRMQKGLTLSRLGSETGFSTALLSKLESERMIPTLQTLLRISRVYGLDLSHFFSPVTHHSLAITRSAHIADPRRDLAASKNTPLHRVTPASRQFSQIVEIPAGVSFDFGSSATRTELTAYVIEGPLHLTAAGVVDVLRTGDCIVLDTDAAAMLTALNAPCRVLTVCAVTRSLVRCD